MAGAGLDVIGLVDQLIFAESATVRRLESKQSGVETKIQAYKDLITKLADLESKISALNDTEKFGAKLGKSSDDDVLTATADSTAANGTHNIVVSRLALLDNFASDETFTTSDDAIGTGSFDLTIDSTTTTITVDSSNDTLTGLKNTINNSGAEVNANIINDGSGFRLTLTSKSSGADNAVVISSNTLTLEGGSPFTFARTHSIGSVAELDASFTLDGLAVTSSSNAVKDAIEGVTLNLVGTSGSTVSVTISDDTETVKTAIQEFVDAYNEAYSFINGQSFFTEGVGAGTLAGDTLLRIIQSDLSSIVSTAVSGLSGPLDNLRAAGVEIQGDGTLKVNDSVLNDNLEDNFSDIKKLFLAFGETSNSNVIFLGVGSSTAAGTYEVNITQLAEAATITGPNDITPTLGANENLTFTLGSDISIVALTTDMTIDEVVTAVNTQFTTDSMALTASKSGSDQLVITSDNKGASVSFTVVSDVDTGPGTSTGIGTGGMSDSGVDIDGTFKDTATDTVYAASATESDVLIGDEGLPTDLRVQFLGSSTGVFGTVTLTLGYAEQLERQLSTLTDSTLSPIDDTVTRLEGLVRIFADDILALQDRLTLRESFLIAEFSRADQALRNLSVLQATISAQITKVF